MNTKRALSIVIIMLVCVPLGLLTDAQAWGEWDLHYYAKKLGFIPSGMEHFRFSFHPVLPDYSAPGHGDIVGYYVSAIAGIAVLYLFWMVIGRIIAKK